MSFLIASFKDTNQIGKKVAMQLKAQHEEIQVKKFPDGETEIKFKHDPQNKTVIIINSFATKPNQKIIETILAAGIAKDYKAKKVILIATYLPYARQDKHFENYDSFSSKHIMNLFSMFDKVIAIDPHNHRVSSLKELAKNASEISTNNLLAEYIRKNYKDDFTIVGPDKESKNWDSKIAKMLGKKAVVLTKTRFSAEKVKITPRKLGNKVIIIDDIISTGHTILETIKIARSQGAEKIVVIGIHALLLGNAPSLITKHAELITTNTIPNKFAKIDVSGLIAEAIKKFT